MVISSRPLIELVPVQPAAMAGRFVCHWDKDSVDDARFVKIDFLGLAMLSVVEDCLEQVWRNRGERVDLGAIPYDDPAVYDQICAGDTVGVFQIGSRAQIQTLARTQPRSLDELAVQVAIVRPGPIVGRAVNPYVERRERLRRDPTYRAPADHPLLDEVLSDTLGVILYQDQVLEVAVAMGGFRPGEADGLRRALSRKRSHEAIEAFRHRFLAGAAEKGVDSETARVVFDKISAFSGYGFPKSHAYAFGALAYQSAWLRRYHPVEFHAALLANQPMGFYAPHVLAGDARRHGVPTLRPSINASAVRSQARGDAVLLGLSSVRVAGLLPVGAVTERPDAASWGGADPHAWVAVYRLAPETDGDVVELTRTWLARALRLRPGYRGMAVVRTGGSGVVVVTVWDGAEAAATAASHLRSWLEDRQDGVVAGVEHHVGPLAVATRR